MGKCHCNPYDVKLTIPEAWGQCYAELFFFITASCTVRKLFRDRYEPALILQKRVNQVKSELLMYIFFPMTKK
jgi:hypothetical protein